MKRSRSKKKNSTKVFIAVTLFAALLFAISSLFIDSKKEIVAAEINNQKIFKSEIDDRLRQIFESQNFSNSSSNEGIPDITTLPKEVIQILAKEIYLEKQLNKQALKSKVAKDKKIQSQILNSKNKILRQAYIDSVIKEKVNEESVREKYTELSSNLIDKKEYFIFHIVTKTKDEADKIAEKLNGKKASKFEDLAKKYSIDTGSAKQGGNLGYIIQDNMFEEIFDVVKDLEKNKISNPVQSKFGWHLIKVTDVRDAEALPFESVKENIREKLIQDTIDEINSAITKDAEVKILLKMQDPEKSEEEKAETKTDSEKTEESSKETKETTEAKLDETTKESENNESQAEEISEDKQLK
jgi:peptidyl-prolyl cis-trans isomerase C